jgi:hypothetical protein
LLWRLNPLDPACEMAITLNSLTLPAKLVWQDEFDWEPVAQSVHACFNGNVVIQKHKALLAARPITLAGGRTGNVTWSSMPRSDIITLRAMLDDEDLEMTLTLHDGRSFSVTPNHNGPALRAFPLPVIGERGPPNPAANHPYVLDLVAFLTIST